MHGEDLAQETLLRQVEGRYDSENKYKNSQHPLGTGCLISSLTLHIDLRCHDQTIPSLWVSPRVYWVVERRHLGCLSWELWTLPLGLEDLSKEKNHRENDCLAPSAVSRVVLVQMSVRWQLNWETTGFHLNLYQSNMWSGMHGKCRCQSWGVVNGPKN